MPKCRQRPSGWLSPVKSGLLARRSVLPSNLQKNKLAKRNRKFRPIIGIEGGGYTLLSMGMRAVDEGRAVLVNGMIRYTEDSKHLGYNRAPAILKWCGRKSGYAGPSVMQAIRV